MAQDATAAPPAFQEALASLATARTRRDVMLVETPAPHRIAPFAIAINGEIADATGRFVLLHDPDGQAAWAGTFRVVALVKAVVEAEVGSDDMWADVAWSWLADALDGVAHHSEGGTVTKTVSRSFGSLAERHDEVTVEIRVSWTPETTDMEPHIVAWTELMAFSAGIPPTPDGVAVLHGRRA
ncbi:MAG: DUF3000 domain-containing protein [Demequina sp.]|jgi:hypothetical protein|nr:DUF3000 domain-containing protein [Demequina sp.]